MSERPELPLAQPPAPTSLVERQQYKEFLASVAEGAENAIALEAAKKAFIVKAFQHLIDQPNVGYEDFFIVRGALGSEKLESPEAWKTFVAQQGSEQHHVWGLIEQEGQAVIEATRKLGGTFDFNRTRSLPEEQKKKWQLLFGFIDHDQVHLTEANIVDHMELISFVDFKYLKGKPGGMKAFGEAPLPAQWLAFYQHIIQSPEFPDLCEHSEFPFQVAEALAELELKQQPQRIEPVDLASMLQTISRSIQLRYGGMDFELTTPNNQTPQRNQIVLDVKPTALETNPGMLWSVLYNVIKNGSKALVSASQDKKIDDLTRNENGPLIQRMCGETGGFEPEKIVVSANTIAEQGSDFTVIHITDTGKGLQLDDIMEGVKDLVKQKLIESAKLGKTAKEIVAAWEENPYGLRRLRVGDVMNLAGVARASGFVGKPGMRGISSGMGLWGVEYLMDKMGGDILYTNTLKEGALFTIIIPNHYFNAERKQRRTIRSATRQISRKAERGDIDLTIPKVA